MNQEQQIKRPLTTSIEFGFELIEELSMKSDHGGQTRTIGTYGRYKITLRFKNNKGEVRIREFEYSDSIVNYQDGKTPTKEDVLYCLCFDYNCNTFSFEEFCSELGYDNDSIKSLNVFKALKKNQTKLNYLFGPETMQKLSEEYQDY